MNKNSIINALSLIALICLSGISLPAHAQWQNDQNNCKVWNDEPAQSKQTANWTGQCKNGYATGQGTIKFSGKEIKSCTGGMLKGKLNGQISCKIAGGSSFSGQVKNGQLHGKGVLKLNQKCPNCIKQFSGVFYNNNMAQGTLTLVNGKSGKLKYYPDQKGCLIWNDEPSPSERISWSGGCKGGYGQGKGVLQYSLNGVTEKFKGNLKLGKLDGYGVVSSSGKKICPQCIKTVSGTFKNHVLQKGKATLGNGQVKQYTPQSEADAIEQMGLEMVLNAQINAQMRSMTNYSLYGQYNPTINTPYRFERPVNSVYR